MSLSKEPNPQVCANGHTFVKLSSCPVCPQCEKEKDSLGFFIQGLSAPARRALENQHITSLSVLKNYSQKEILQLHGIGKSSIPILEKALLESGFEFKST